MIKPYSLSFEDRIEQLSPEQLDRLLRGLQRQAVEDPDLIRPRQPSPRGAPLSFA